ncbi:MAG TPA: hypothetical protein V6D34_14110 [Candidatus Sericytochromatia bacterium]
MRTLYPLKHWIISPTGVITAVLSTTIALAWLASSSHTTPVALAVPALASTAQCSMSSVSVLSATVALQVIPQGLDSFEPPDNGGPGRTTGSGTRWGVESV